MKNSDSAIENSVVLQMNDTAARPRLEVKFDHLPIGVFVGSEVIANRLFFDVQFFGDAVDTPSWQAVLDAAEFFKRNIHTWKDLDEEMKFGKA